MDLSAKLQIKPGQRIAVVPAAPDVPDLPDVSAGVPLAAGTGEADVVVAFARTVADLDGVAGPAVEAARADKLAWIAYPKAGQLGTDLNRDVLARSLTGRGVRPVRQVAIDDVWSALRFRPA
jgi:hypothetical protein